MMVVDKVKDLTVAVAVVLLLKDTAKEDNKIKEAK